MKQAPFIHRSIWRDNKYWISYSIHIYVVYKLIINSSIARSGNKLCLLSININHNFSRFVWIAVEEIEETPWHVVVRVSICLCSLRYVERNKLVHMWRSKYTRFRWYNCWKTIKTKRIDSLIRIYSIKIWMDPLSVNIATAGSAATTCSVFVFGLNKIVSFYWDAA